MTLFFLSSATCDVESTIAQLSALPADLAGAEVRADRFERPPSSGDLSALRAATSRTLIHTCRTGDRTAALQAAEAALHAGFDLVDIDASVVSPSEIPGAMRSRTVLSLHDFSSVSAPDRMLASLIGRGAAQVKVALTPRSFDEDLDLLEELHRNRAQGNVTLFGMGAAGLYSRAAAPLFGSSLAFVARDSESIVAPGQLTCDEARQLYGTLDQVGASDRVLFAVAGSPVRHSRSPEIHNAIFRTRDNPAFYGWIETGDIVSVLRAIDSNRFAAPAGISITAPHKETAYSYARSSGAELTARARDAGAVNTYVRIAGRTIADNTDVIAFDRIVAALPAASTVAVAGSGGTARAAALALANAQRRTVLYARDSPRAALLRESFGFEQRDIAELASSECDVLINTLPSDACSELSLDVLSRVRHYVAAAYGAGADRLVQAARVSGAAVVDGEQLLALQADEQARLFQLAIAAATERARGSR